MPQELTDAEWLKDMATRFNFEQRGWSDRLRSIAAKLERGAVEFEDWRITRERLVSAAMSWGLPSDKVDAFVEDAKKSFARLWAEVVAADPDRFAVMDTITTAGPGGGQE